jgi:general nucleoside transport system permease protein
MFGLILGALVITYRVDQIIAGVAINLFVLGMTSYVSSQVLTQHRFLNNAPVFRAYPIPFLSDLPVVGPVLFRRTSSSTARSSWWRWRPTTSSTPAGLRARAVGEHPEAADTLGINVYRTRLHQRHRGRHGRRLRRRVVHLGVGRPVRRGMTGGRGFIGLAAMIFGRWHPIGALMAALVFGFADSLQQKLAILQTPIPSEFLAMAPYIATIVLVAGIVGRARPPAADGKPYIKE